MCFYLFIFCIFLMNLNIWKFLSVFFMQKKLAKAVKQHFQSVNGCIIQRLRFEKWMGFIHFINDPAMHEYIVFMRVRWSNALAEVLLYPGWIDFFAWRDFSDALSSQVVIGTKAMLHARLHLNQLINTPHFFKPMGYK